MQGQMAILEETILAFQPRGIKLHQAWNSFAINGPGFRSLMAIATAYRPPLFIHLYARKDVKKLVSYIGEHQDIIISAERFSGPSGVDSGV